MPSIWLCPFDFTSQFRIVILTYTEYAQVANSLKAFVNQIFGIHGPGTHWTSKGNLIIQMCFIESTMWVIFTRIIENLLYLKFQLILMSLGTQSYKVKNYPK